MNIIEEAQLMRMNRVAVVTALNDLGFAEINEKTPLSKIAEYIKWAGGLRDLQLAVVNKYTGKRAYYTEEQWDALSASGKAACVKLGIRIRAERQDFIIAKENCVRKSNGSQDIPWCGSYIDVKGLTNYGEGSTGHLLDIDGEANTDLILAHGEANDVTFKAAEAARNYKASTLSDGGYEDPTKWSLPAVGQLWLLYKYRKQINAALTTFFGSAYIISDTWHWSSTEYNSSSAWYVYMSYGYVYSNLKHTASRVRAVSPVGRAEAIQTL